MLTLTIPHAIIGGLLIFGLNGLVTLGAAMLGFKLSIAQIKMEIKDVKEDVAQHHLTLYGKDLANGLRGTVQDHGSRIGSLERERLEMHGFARDLRQGNNSGGMQHG